MLDAQSKTLLAKYTMAAKKIIYDPEKMREFMKMLGTKEGALSAVHTVMAMISAHRQIPPQIAPLLGVNIYLAMVDVAQRATKHKADPGVMKQVISAITSAIGGQAPAQPQQPAPAPQGLVASQMQGAPA